MIRRYWMPFVTSLAAVVFVYTVAPDLSSAGRYLAVGALLTAIGVGALYMTDGGDE